MSGQARQVLLLTSTIAPKSGVRALKHVDPSARLADYMTALRHYVVMLKSGVFDALVYVDNSGWPLDEIKTIARTADVESACEFISYDAEAPRDVGRFFLESQLLVEAFSRSRFLNRDPVDTIWKVTGRYVIANLDSIVRTRPADFDLYVNCRNYPSQWCDFYVAAWRRSCFETLFSDVELEAYRRDPNGEAALRRRIDSEAFSRLNIVKRMRRTPQVIGVRGYDGVRYNGLSYAAKYFLRALANRVAPWLWV